MRVYEIEEYYKDEETLEKVLGACKEDFDKIDYWSGVRKDNLTDNPEEITRALNELSGCYANLRVVLGIAKTEKKNREVRNYENIRINAGKEGKKITDASAKQEASASVIKYRRIRNIIEAYVEACDKHIITLQSILKDLGKDWNHPQG